MVGELQVTGNERSEVGQVQMLKEVPSGRNEKHKPSSCHEWSGGLWCLGNHSVSLLLAFLCVCKIWLAISRSFLQVERHSPQQ